MNNANYGESSLRKEKNMFIGIIVALALVVIGLSIWLTVVMIGNNRNKVALENNYRHSFYELTDSMDNLEVELSKLMVASGSDQRGALTLNAYRQAEIAETSVSNLPFEADVAVEMSKFLNQVGDFSKSYNRALMTGADTTSFKANVKPIYEATKQLNEQFFAYAKLMEDGYKFLDNKSVMPQIVYEEKNNKSVEYPELIYDGPFSDGQNPGCYKDLQGLMELDDNAAREKLKMIFNDYKIEKIDLLGTSEGDVVCYEYMLNTDKGEMFVSLSRQGGKVISMTRYRNVVSVNLSESAASNKAREACEKMGLKVQPVWYNAGSGVAYINLAPVVNDIIYYTDLVKVKVALDDGELLGIEATGYCKNHSERELKPTITKATAISLVDRNLMITAVRPCLIPMKNSEVLCFEVNAKLDNLDYFIYIDAKSGDEVNILRVIDGDQGKLII